MGSIGTSGAIPVNNRALFLPFTFLLPTPPEHGCRIRKVHAIKSVQPLRSRSAALEGISRLVMLGSASLLVAWAARAPPQPAPVVRTAVGAGLTWSTVLTGFRGARTTRACGEGAGKRTSYSSSLRSRRAARMRSTCSTSSSVTPSRRRYRRRKLSSTCSHMARVGCKPRVHGPRRCNFQRKCHSPANFSAQRKRRSPVSGSRSVHLISMVILAFRMFWPYPAWGLPRPILVDPPFRIPGRPCGRTAQPLEERLQIRGQRHRPV